MCNTITLIREIKWENAGSNILVVVLGEYNNLYFISEDGKEESAYIVSIVSGNFNLDINGKIYK